MTPHRLRPDALHPTPQGQQRDPCDFCHGLRGQGFGTVRTPDRYFAAETVVDEAMDWLGQQREKPFFMWLHFFDPHTPTLPPEPFAEGLVDVSGRGLGPGAEWREFRLPGPRSFLEERLGGHPDLYDGEVAYLDRQVDRLMGFLAERGLLANTFVVLVGDHGESLGEHGLLHTHAGLYDPSIHVPMLIRWPDRWRERGQGGARRFDGLVQTLDLFPTLLGLAGLQVPERIDAVDLYRLGTEGRPAVFIEHANRFGAAVRTARYKYIQLQGHPGLSAEPQLFDLLADPGETMSLSSKQPSARSQLADALDHWRRASVAEPLGVPRSKDEEDLEQLRALGYLR